eukprot:4932352-Amphidinium_carterae.1
MHSAFEPCARQQDAAGDHETRDRFKLRPETCLFKWCHFQQNAVMKTLCECRNALPCVAIQSRMKHSKPNAKSLVDISLLSRFWTRQLGTSKETVPIAEPSSQPFRCDRPIVLRPAFLKCRVESTAGMQAMGM